MGKGKDSFFLKLFPFITEYLYLHDKIRYAVQTDGSVIMARANQSEPAPVLANLLTFLANDISQNSQNVSAINSDLLNRIRPLVSDVEIDLDSPLSEEDE